MSSPLALATTPPLAATRLAPERWSYVAHEYRVVPRNAPDRPISLLELGLPERMQQAACRVYRSLLDELHRMRFCRHCMKKYTLWHTMGLHQCYGHPGHYDARHGVWACCQQARFGGTRPGFIDGCTPVDHLDYGQHTESHQHSEATTDCIPLLVFLMMPQREQRAVEAVYHEDRLPKHYKKAFVRARYGWMLDEEEEEDALEEWNGDFGSVTFTPPFLRGTGAATQQGQKQAAGDDAVLAEYDEETFRWAAADLRLDEFHVILRHVQSDGRS